MLTILLELPLLQIPFNMNNDISSNYRLYFSNGKPNNGSISSNIKENASFSLYHPISEDSSQLSHFPLTFSSIYSLYCQYSHFLKKIE